MKTLEEYQCPNCWGYQEYNEQLPDREMCKCEKTTKES